MRLIEGLGRWMFASLFIVSGLMKLQQFNYNDGGSLMPQVSPKLDSSLSSVFSAMPSSAVGVDDVQPHYPKLLLAAIILEVSGGVLFALGSTLGAYMLMLFVLPVTLVMHDFWNEAREEHREIELVQFAKNFVILGALISWVDMKANLRQIGKTQRAAVPTSSRA